MGQLALNLSVGSQPSSTGFLKGEVVVDERPNVIRGRDAVGILAA